MLNNRDVSVLITARNEEFLARTVEDVLAKKRANTEVVVVADGYWPNPPVPDHPDVTFIHHEKSVGQRGGVNDAARVATGKYIMKLDAHCVVDEGFDVKLMADCEYDWIVVPAMYNLHAFNWKCLKCGNEWYQGPTPRFCHHNGEDRGRNENCDNTTDFERVIVWKPRWHRRSESMCFDEELHFQYWGGWTQRPEFQGDVVPIMSMVGASWFLHRERYWELGGLDEEHGSWGQMGTELACKAWLSGGKLVVNKKTWFAHLFRTQGGDFTFPYPNPNNKIQQARVHSQRLWRENKWPMAKHSLRWMVEKFWPVKGWSEKKLHELKYLPGEDVNENPFLLHNDRVDVKKETVIMKPKEPTKGIIYYTDNQLNVKIAQLCKKQIKSIGLPIVSASLKPMDDMGKNIHVKMERGYLAYFTQILSALEAIDTDIVYFCEHDVLYHPSHFKFTPVERDRYYYNFNFWRLRSSDGHAIHYDTHQVNLICGYRDLLIKHYRKRMEMIKDYLSLGDNAGPERFFGEFVRAMGFEPGTHNRRERVDDYKAERFDSAYPCIDIRHGANLTASRWHPSEFRDQRNCRNWQETDEIPGWGKWNPQKLRF